MAGSAEEVFYYYCFSCQISYDPDEIRDGEDIGMPKQTLYGTKNPSCSNCGKELELITKEFEKSDKIYGTVQQKRQRSGVKGLEAKLC